jgi:hypothetical protein
VSAIFATPGSAAGLSATSARTPQIDAIAPSDPPSAESSAPSVIHCRINLASVAPIARRTANSFSRDTARTSIR